MTTNHHTDISVGAAVDASVVNAPDGQLDSAITQMLNGSKAFAQLNFTDTTLVLASDSITVTNSAHRVDTEGAAAADNLQTIVGGVDGDLLLLQSVAAARVVTAKHNLATLWHGNEADFVFDDPRHALLYLYDSANLRYCEVGRPVGMEKIITHTQLGSSVASVTMSFSPVYRHLFLVGGFRTDRAATTDDLIIRYNADAAAANYGSTGAAFSTGAAYQEVLTTVATGNIVYVGAAAATAPALILVGYLMMATLTKGESEADHDTGACQASINFANLAFGLPAVLIMTIMPLTYSITNGIGFGFIAYTLIRVTQGRAREVSWMLWLASAGFVLYFLIPLLQAKGWV